MMYQDYYSAPMLVIVDGKLVVVAKVQREAR